MIRRLPSLNAIRAFESAGRHLSFTKAAEELNVTPTAISHQIKALEDALGVPLFIRLTRSLRLTDAGKEALPILGQGMDKLAEGIEQIVNHAESHVLTVSVSPSFGAMWLVPRLNRFRDLHPDIEISIDGTDTLANLENDGVDVAVRYGPGGYKGVRCEHLFQRVNTPVCSPALLAGKHALRRPEDLRFHTLLHIDWKDNDAKWASWLEAMGLHDIDPTRGPLFSMENMAVQAALEGQGVALPGDVLVADELASGRLVRPFDASLSTPVKSGYYLLSIDDGTRQFKIDAFRTWLLEEAEISRLAISTES